MLIWKLYDFASSIYNNINNIVTSAIAGNAS